MVVVVQSSLPYLVGYARVLTAFSSDANRFHRLVVVGSSGSVHRHMAVSVSVMGDRCDDLGHWRIVVDGRSDMMDGGSDVMDGGSMVDGGSDVMMDDRRGVEHLVRVHRDGDLDVGRFTVDDGVEAVMVVGRVFDGAFVAVRVD